MFCVLCHRGTCQLQRLVLKGGEKCSQMVLICTIFRVQDYALLVNWCEIPRFVNYKLRYMYYVYISYLDFSLT